MGDLERYRAKIAELLQIRIAPLLSQVVRQVDNLCSCKPSGYKDQSLHAYLKMDTMRKIYLFIQGHQDQDEVKRLLSDRDCVLVDNGYTFVKPYQVFVYSFQYIIRVTMLTFILPVLILSLFQVVINLYDEAQIVPYLYRSPTELGEFKDLFVALSATLTASVDQYSMVLENIYNQTQGAKLHPNELRIAFKAVHGLFQTLQRSPQVPVHAEAIYLPSRSGRLLSSHKLVFNDDPSFTDRIRDFDHQFLVDLAECNIHVVNYEDLINLLPRKLRPQMLTSLVTEKLETGCRKSAMRYLLSVQINNDVITLIQLYFGRTITSSAQLQGLFLGHCPAYQTRTTSHWQQGRYCLN